MKRIAPFAAVLLAACSQEPTASRASAGTYAGEGRDRLCIAGEGAGQRAGVIAYGAADANCSASGRLEATATGLALVPAGDDECRIPLVMTGSDVRVGELPAACAYYCGPGATLAGKAFSKDSAVTPVTDLAGDPLC